MIGVVGGVSDCIVDGGELFGEVGVVVYVLCFILESWGCLDCCCC